MPDTDGSIDEFDCFEDRSEKDGRQVTLNDKYREDVNYAIELNRWIANAIGIWPVDCSKASSGDGSFARLIKRTTLYFLLGFLLLPGILHILFEERTLKRRLLKVGPMMMTLTAAVKYTFMLLQQAKVRKCLSSMESHWRRAGSPELRALMRRNADVGRRLTRLCAITFYCGGLCYRLVRTLLIPSVVRDGLVHRPLSSPLYAGIFRFNASASPVYEAIFATQILGAFALHSTTITTCSYAAVLAAHACGQLDLVVHLLARLIRPEEVPPRDRHSALSSERMIGRKLKIIIRLHLRVLRFIENIEELMHEICLVEIFSGTMVLCLTGYYFVMDLQNNDALGLITYTVMITSLIALLFTYCYIGELVSNKAKNVGNSSYMINWYELPPKKELYIGLIISISRNSTKLTAGKMLELSMYNFGCIMKSAAGYLNLLRTMTD